MSLPSVTYDRVKESLTRLNLSYSTADDGDINVAFDELNIWISLTQNANVLQIMGFPYQITCSRNDNDKKAVLMSVAHSINSTRVAPRVSVIDVDIPNLENPKELIERHAINFYQVFICANGMSDEQIDEFLNQAFSTNFMALNEVNEQLSTYAAWGEK